jgi:hypothetical protein
MKLVNYNTNQTIRSATEAEQMASYRASLTDGGAGVIEVDGVSCFVDGPGVVELRQVAEALAIAHIECGESEGWLAEPDDADTFEDLDNALRGASLPVDLVGDLREELRTAIKRLAFANIVIRESAPEWGEGHSREETVALDAAYLTAVESRLEEIYPGCNVTHELVSAGIQRRITGNADEASVVAALESAWEAVCSTTDEELARMVYGE